MQNITSVRMGANWLSDWFNMLLFTLFGLFSYSNGFGQSVDPLTGRLEMVIPIGKLEANDISIPISIYHKGDESG
jgi:hypothetical protein